MSFLDRAERLFDKTLRRWRWDSMAIPIYAAVMVISGTMMYISPGLWDTPTYQVLYDTIPIYLWATANLFVGGGVLLYSRKDRGKWLEFMIAGMLMLEAMFIFLAVLDNHNVAPTAVLRCLAISLMIWLALLGRTDQISRVTLRQELERDE